MENLSELSIQYIVETIIFVLVLIKAYYLHALFVAIYRYTQNKNVDYKIKNNHIDCDYLEEKYRNDIFIFLRVIIILFLFTLLFVIAF